jgi:hypothetical protein
MAMELVFNGQRTIPIEVRPSFNVCNSNIIAQQTITTSTVDNSQFGGVFDVSMYLQFRLFYRNEVTRWIDANPTGSTDCSATSAQIQSALQSLSYFHSVSVNGVSLSPSQDCQWTISFDSVIGDLDQLQVQTQNQLSKAVGNVGFSSTSGDDTVQTAILKRGQKDSIKAALEELDNVGTVTVTPVSNAQSSKGECSWLVTFDSNAGDLSSLQVQVFSYPNSPVKSSTSASQTLNGVMVEISQIQSGTSSVIGGNFALSYLGSRTVYLPFDADERMVQNALENLPTIGKVLVHRSSKDENNGYTWTVTFLTNLGSLNLIQFDNSDMTGTFVNGNVKKLIDGVSPPFNSLDPRSNLPLGSIMVTDLDNLEATVTGLDQGIAYYFRVAAVNSIGQGPYSFSSVPYAIPQPQRPGSPIAVELNKVDGSSLQVTFNPPQLDGGQAITFYKVDYANEEFVAEVQQINAACQVVNEIQVVNISTSHSIPSVQLLYVATTYQGTPKYEVQLVTCDATGGSFRLSFNGLTTAGIPYNANASLIATTLQQLANIDSVNVSFTAGVSQACFQRSSSVPSGGFQVTFVSTQKITGNLPLMTGYTNSLQGSRYLSVSEVQSGDAPISGTLRLSFRGEITKPISFAISSNNYAVVASSIQASLIQLSTIPANGVVVSYDRAPLNPYSQIWRVTFISPELGGTVEPIEIVDYYNELVGSNVAASLLTDGLETQIQRGNSLNSSIAGNQVSGQFTLTYRGHTTDLIDFNAADTDVKAKLEALPNIGVVDVERTGPSVYLEYSWRITFKEMPGAYPAGTGNVVPLIPNFQNILGGSSSLVSVTTVQVGSVPLGGTFSLTISANGVDETAGNIPSDASASELEGFLNSLTNVGTVSVSRFERPDGYQWLVTFDGCKIVNGTDICNAGDVQIMVPDNSLMQCALAPISVMTVVNGSGPATNCPANQDGICSNYVTDLSNIPYTSLLEGLTAGMTYYTQVSAHNR